ncbi:MAG: isochorismatase family protein, partial [Streptosporangiales bacterium]|nr:isochorismatase family protein [Streptosporangiales bacterium]
MTSSPTRRAPWADVISPDEWRLHTTAGYGKRAVPGRRPALLVVDVTYEFTGDGTGDSSLPGVLDRFPNACGDAARDALPRIRALIEHARGIGIPVCYSKMTDDRGPWSRKNRRAPELVAAPAWVSGIHADLAPRDGELVVTKASASALSGTPLLDELRRHEVDTVIVTGCATGGCVRATVLDAFGAGLTALVPHEAVFDRTPVPHQVSLFDMDMRYAN